MHILVLKTNFNIIIMFSVPMAASVLFPLLFQTKTHYVSHLLHAH